MASKDNANPDKNCANPNSVGYFATLNLNFFATDEDIKRNFSQLHNQFVGKAHHSEEKRTILQNINTAYAVLEDKNSRECYLHMLTIRYILSQAQDLEEINKHYSGRVFPFMIFEVFKKIGSSFSPRVLKFDFLNRTLYEYKDKNLIKGYNFSSLTGAVSGFRKDELLINILEIKESISHQIKVKHLCQRDLVVQVCLLAKDVYEKRNFNLIHFRNPNTEHLEQENVQKRSGSLFIKSSKIKLISNDRLVPPKSVLKTAVFKKGGFWQYEKKIYLILGTTQILLCRDENANDIDRVIPIVKDSVILQRLKPDTLLISIAEEKIMLRFINDEDCSQFFEKINELAETKAHIPEIISLPYSKKDVFVTKLKKDKLFNIKKKVEETKRYLEILIKTQRSLELEIDEEESKPRLLSRKSLIWEKDESPQENAKKKTLSFKDDSKRHSHSPHNQPVEGEGEEEDLDLMRKTSQKIKNYYFKSHNMF